MGFFGKAIRRRHRANKPEIERLDENLEGSGMGGGRTLNEGTRGSHGRGKNLRKNLNDRNSVRRTKDETKQRGGADRGREGASTWVSEREKSGFCTGDEKNRF